MTSLLVKVNAKIEMVCFKNSGLKNSRCIVVALHGIAPSNGFASWDESGSTTMTELLSELFQSRGREDGLRLPDVQFKGLK